jgi:hypothetical protein
MGLGRNQGREMTLATFIANYIPKSLRSKYDFESNLGWMHIANMILREFATKGYIVPDKIKEVGVEVDKYFWVTIPSDCNHVIDISLPVDVDADGDPDDKLISIPHEIVNGKIKLLRSYKKDASPDNFTLSSWATTGVSIDDDDATTDQWNSSLLVITNGTESGKTYIIADSAAADGGVAALTFLHATGVAASTSTAGYLTEQYLMLKYLAEFNGLSAVSDELPVTEKFYNCLAAGMVFKDTNKDDTKYPVVKQELLDEVEKLENCICTPTADQARIGARSMPGLDSRQYQPDFPDYPDVYGSMEL